MIKAILVCTQGMSTNIMKMKIEEAAKNNQKELDIQAVGLDELDTYLKGTDIVILGPQIKYAEKMIREQLDKVDSQILMMCMEPADFGLMRGTVVYQKMLDCLKQQ